mmetsp:Transcript_4646/g.9305  ORF Transcript_4646/g.9305 Transcript_4646/m.9305 type:complete len:106 (+) Transcript_4646:165-482(+)
MSVHRTTYIYGMNALHVWTLQKTKTPSAARMAKAFKQRQANIIIIRPLMRWEMPLAYAAAWYCSKIIMIIIIMIIIVILKNRMEIRKTTRKVAIATKKQTYKLTN